MATMKSAAIVATASGDTELIAAPGADRRIVFRYVAVAEAAVGIKFKSGSDDLTGAMKAAANGGVASSVWLYCAENEALSINLDDAQNVGGHVEYRIDSLSAAVG